MDLPAVQRPKVRADKKARTKAASQLMKLILADIPFWYELIKSQSILAEKQQDPAVRMASKVLDKILAEVRETEETVPHQQFAPVQVLIGVGIERGTIGARELALQHQQEQRITLSVDDKDQVAADAGTVRPTESERSSVP